MDRAQANHLAELLRRQVGHSQEEALGDVTRQLIGRFALAVGLDDPIHFDPESARRRGFPDVVAPPNLLPSVRAWGEGPPETALLPDGSITDASESEGFQRMGGGHDVTVHHPVVAGQRIVRRITIVDVEVKEGRSGSLVLVHRQLDYCDEANGRVVVTDRETEIIR